MARGTFSIVPVRTSGPRPITTPATHSKRCNFLSRDKRKARVPHRGRPARHFRSLFLFLFLSISSTVSGTHEKFHAAAHMHASPRRNRLRLSRLRNNRRGSETVKVESWSREPFNYTREPIRRFNWFSNPFDGVIDLVRCQQRFFHTLGDSNVTIC